MSNMDIMLREIRYYSQFLFKGNKEAFWNEITRLCGDEIRVRIAPHHMTKIVSHLRRAYFHKREGAVR